MGNPPFAGKNTIAAGNRAGYGAWLQTLHEGAHGNADLVAHFFRRAFGLLRRGGVFGLIATNTIGQGDTRDTGLTAILGQGGAIARAIRRLKWPGEAAVVVSVVHVAKGAVRSPILDGRQVRRISAYLVEGDLDTSPAPLAANAGKAFIGSYVLGMGFTFDDEAAVKGIASSLSEMRRLIEKDPRNAERIFPYIGGEEVNNHPRQEANRYVIDFADLPLVRAADLPSWFTIIEPQRREYLRQGVVPLDYPDQVAADWPDLLAIVEMKVKSARLRDNREVRRRRWWQFAERCSGLYSTISGLPRLLAISRVSSYLGVTQLQSGMVFSDQLVMLGFTNSGPFAVLQSRIHDLWARSFSSTLGDGLRYTPSDCFRTFPFPPGFETSPTLEAAGKAYYAHRAALMIERNEGLTKIYNRFHARSETAADIERLRELHAEMDRAVLIAYGWADLAERACPEFIEQEVNEGKTPKTRLDWPAEFKDHVLSRLLALNAERAAAERAAGFTPAAEASDDVADEALLEGIDAG